MKIHSLSLLILVFFIITAKQAEGQVSLAKQNNDSAQHYLDILQTKKARACIERVHTAGASGKEEVRSYLLLGNINKEEGYISVSLSNYRKAKQLAAKHKDRVAEGIAVNGMANRLVYLGELDSVLWYCEESMHLDTGLKNQLENYMIMGQYWETKMQYDKVWTNYQYVYDKAKELQDNLMISRALTGMHNVYLFQYKDIDRAIEYQHQALRVLDSSKHANRMSLIYTSIASGYLTPGYRNNIKENYKMANLYLDRAQTIIELTGNLFSKGYMLQHIAVLKETQGASPNELMPYAKETLQINRALGQKKELKLHILNVGYLHMQLKNYNDARKLLLEGLALSKELKDVIFLDYYYETLATLDSLTTNYSQAYSNLKRAMVYKDSIYTTNKVKAVEEIQAKYENEQKAKIIAEKELIIQEQKHQQARIMGITFIFLLALLAIILWIVNRQKAVFQKEKERQNHLRLQAIVSTQEEVQQNIARDIHDGLVQVLGAAKMSLQAININGDKDVIHDRIKNASVIMDEACTEARNISHQILPYSLMKDGLLPALDELLKKSLTNVAYQFHFSGMGKRLDKDIEINMYRIAQELIQNALKHSSATHIVVQLEDQRNKLSLSVKDNGKGYDPDLIKRGSVGLTNVKTRVELIRGIFKMDSAPDFGTNVKVEVPL